MWPLLLLSLQCAVWSVRAQFGPDQRWLNPNGSVPDFTYTYTLGDTVEFSWTALNASLSDMWLTNSDNTVSNFNVSLATNVNISTAGSFRWTATVETQAINNDNKFVIRFFPAGAAYGILQFSQNISPGFVLQLREGARTTTAADGSLATTTVTSSASSAIKSTSSSSIATTASSSSSASTSYSTIPTDASSSSSTITPPQTSTDGMTTGAKIGIAIGAVVGGVALMACGCFLGRRYRIQRRTDGPPVYEPQPMPPSPSFAQFGSEIGLSEKRSTSRLEMLGDKSYPSEADSIRIKPGMHEMS